MSSSELYQSGRLTEAVVAAQAAVKQNPTDTQLRGQLCELLCFVGELEKADKQLDVIGQQDPGAAVGVSLLRQLIRAETARQQFYDEGRLPEFLAEVSPVLRLHLDASIRLRDGATAEAADLLAQAEQQRTHVQGVCDGQPFDDLRDLDDLSAPFFEVLTSTGKYYWIPMESVESVEFRPPERPVDLLWRRAHMSVANGPDGEVFVCALYPGTHVSDDDKLRLGRATQWVGGDGEPVRGVGLRMMLLGNEDKAILELKELEFKAGPQPGDAAES